MVKTHGLSGELSGFIETDNPLSYTNLKSVFFATKDGIIPFPIEQFSIEKNAKFKVKFKNIDTIEEARKLINKPFYLPLSVLPKLSGKNFYFHEIIGFSVIDKTKGNIGIIKSMIENPAQPIFSIFLNEKEILVPAHDNIIEKIDRTNKILYLDCPNGLIDIYLETI